MPQRRLFRELFQRSSIQKLQDVSETTPVNKDILAFDTSLDPDRWAPKTVSELDLINGPASSTDNAVARWNGTTGEALQDSTSTIDDDGNVTHENDGAVMSMTLTDYVALGANVQLIGRAAFGSKAIPVALGAGDGIFVIQGHAHNGSAFVNTAQIRMLANENQGVSNGGSQMTFHTTADGAITPDEQVQIADDGLVTMHKGLAVTGDITVTGLVDGKDIDGELDFFNGTFLEEFDATVTSNGTIITMAIAKAGGGDLTKVFSSGYTMLSPDTIALTAGSDSSPQVNFIYILESDGILTKSTSAWPLVEHIKVAFFFCQSAAKTQSDGGALINQNWNDPAEESTGQGHLGDITQRLRLESAGYFSGVDGNGDDDYMTHTAGNTELIITSGLVFQLHKQTFPAFNTATGSTVNVKNWFGDSYHELTNLFDIVDDSTGTTIGANKYFNLVIWGVINKTGEHQEAFINLPSGFYNTQSAAENDVSGFDDFTIPREFAIDSSAGFLICRTTLQMAGTWVHVSTVDLRGTSPQSASGGASGVATEFADNTFHLFDEGDNTKIGDFDIGTLVTTGTTRTLTWPDADWDLGAAKTKLDGIETAATADQTDGEIETAFKANAGTRQGMVIAYNDNNARTASINLKKGATQISPTRTTPMLYAGRIIGHTCGLEIQTAVSGDVSILVRNATTEQATLTLEFGFGLGAGDHTDTVDLSGGTPVEFSAGDVINFRAVETGDMGWRLVDGHIIVEFDN